MWLCLALSILANINRIINVHYLLSYSENVIVAYQVFKLTFIIIVINEGIIIIAAAVRQQPVFNVN